MTEDAPKRGSYVAPALKLSQTERRRQRRRARRISGHYRTESPAVSWFKRVGLVLFIAAGIALMIYALFFYR